MPTDIDMQIEFARNLLYKVYWKKNMIIFRKRISNG